MEKIKELINEAEEFYANEIEPYDEGIYCKDEDMAGQTLADDVESGADKFYDVGRYNALCEGKDFIERMKKCFGDEQENQEFIINLWGNKKYKRNPNIVDVELLPSEIEAIIIALKDYTKAYKLDDKISMNFVINPILEKLKLANSKENREKSYKKSLIEE